jgi:hypothetical protein
MQKALDPLENGSAMHRVNQYLTQQGNALQDVLCRGTKSTEDVNKQIGEFSKNLRTQISEIIGSAITTDTGGLGLLMRQIKDEVTALRDTVVATKTARESSSALIGSSFEESCNQKFANFVVSRSSNSGSKLPLPRRSRWHHKTVVPKRSTLRG